MLKENTIIEEKSASEGMSSEARDNCKQPLIHRLARTMWAIKSVYEIEPGLTLLHVMILSRLGEQDGLTQNDLTGSLRVDPSIITRIVKQMEHEHEWIRRKRDPQDNRLMRVYLTDKGREQSKGLEEKIAATEQRITRRLSADQIDSLKEILVTLEETARADSEVQK